MGRESRARAAGLVVEAPAEDPLERITRLARRYNEAARAGQPPSLLLQLHRDLARAMRQARHVETLRAGARPGFLEALTISAPGVPTRRC